MLSVLRCAAAVLVASQAVLGQDQPTPHLLADLDYGSFQGAYHARANLSYWRKIPYAAPPIGDNRFRGPQPVQPVTSPYNSSETFESCPQRGTVGAEDCLYLGLYSRPWTKGQPLKPVVVLFYSGGHIQGGGPLGALPPSSVALYNITETTDIMFVQPNYRANAFGFLPGKEIADDPSSDLNPGLLDQEAAVRWTSKYIREFGGDPDNITLWGQSAGGGSVIAQSMARGGEQKKLFKRAMASSPFWPKTYTHGSPEAQALYDTLAESAGCAGPESLKCLKSLDVQAIRDATPNVTNLYRHTTGSFTWAFVIDGEFLREPLSAATAKGLVNAEVAFGMHNTREGQGFMPPGAVSDVDTGTPPYNSSEASFDVWLRAFLPGFADCEIEAVKRLYPAEGDTGTIVYNTTAERGGLIYRDTVLTCPALWLAKAVPKGGWLGEFNMGESRHGGDTYWWNNINNAQTQDPLRYRGYAGAMASFFQTGDPNALKLTPADVPGPPSVKDGLGWVMDDSEEAFRTMDLEQLEEKCAFWRKTGARVPV